MMKHKLCCDNCGKGLRLTREGDEVFWAHEDGKVVCS